MKKFFLFLVLSLSLQAQQTSYGLPDFLGVPLDLKLEKLLNFRGGVFIEAGANDGLRQSNTKLFEEKYGWTGILIEPSEDLFAQLQKNRPFARCYQCALGSFDEDGTFMWGDFDGDLMASLGGNRLHRTADKRVLVRSLQSILDEEGTRRVDLFSLDTEGHELNILRGIDFGKTDIEYLLIEVYASQFREIISFLDAEGYDLVSCLSNYNRATNPGWDGTHNDYLFKKRRLR
jgi:FkbM family methyltransferase